MAKKSKADRSDPKKNKSLAIRTVLAKLPKAKAAEVVVAVRQEFGHKVNPTLVYLVKSKQNMRADGRPKRVKGTPSSVPMNSAATWVVAIRLSRELLKVTGSVANATAILKAVES